MNIGWYVVDTAMGCQTVYFNRGPVPLFTRQLYPNALVGRFGPHLMYLVDKNKLAVHPHIREQFGACLIQGPYPTEPEAISAKHLGF